MILTCVTSRYLPNLRHIARLCEVDLAVVLDLAPLPHRNRDSFVTRNRIHQQATDQDHWLTVPVLRHGSQQVREAVVDPTDHRWAAKHMKTLRYAYPQADAVAPGFLDALGDALRTNVTSLLDINCAVLEVILDALGRRQHLPVLESTVVDVHRKEHRSDIAQVLGSNVYLAGEVERQSIADSGLDRTFVEAGILLRQAASTPPDLESKAVRYSSVHLICTAGMAAASDALSRLIEPR